MLLQFVQKERNFQFWNHRFEFMDMRIRLYYLVSRVVTKSKIATSDEFLIRGLGKFFLVVNEERCSSSLDRGRY